MIWLAKLLNSSCLDLFYSDGIYKPDIFVLQSSANPMTRSLSLTVLLLLVLMTGQSQPWTQAPWYQGSESEPKFYDYQQAYERMLEVYDEHDIPGWKQFRRWEWRWEEHVFPDGTLPDPAQYYYARLAFLAGNPTPVKHNGTWVPLGIESWINGTSGYNPGNGRINVVVNDPNDTNIIYVGSPSGGLWKSSDFGQTWTTAYDNIAVLGVSAIAVNPFNGDELFIGTGDRDAGDTKAIGILYSNDAGASFQPTGFSHPASTLRVNDILINPVNPNSLIAANSQGIHQSYDKGATWSQRFSGAEIKNLEYRPGDTTVLYASGQAFYRSVNSGLSFSKVLNGIAHDTSRLELAVSPANANMVWVLASNAASRFGALFMSLDLGASFRLMSDTPNILGYATNGSDDKGQGWYDLAIAVDPENPAHVFAGGVNVWHSLDTGKTWQILSHWVFGNTYEYTHADIHHLGFSGNRLFCGSDGGVFYSPDKGESWVDLSEGLGITQFYRLGLYGPSDSLIAAGAQDNGSNLYRSGTWYHVFGADGMEADVRDDDPYVVYVSSQNGGLRISIDGGETFQGIKPTGATGNWVTPFAVHPKKPTMITAAYDRVYRSYNEGFDWIQISNVLAGGGNTLRYLALAPSDTAVVYAARGAVLYTTFNSGVNWASRVPSGSYSITGITVDNMDAKRIWVSLSASSGDKVMYSADGGLTWSDLTGNLGNFGFNCITRRDNSPDALYLGTMSGVYYRDSLLGTWIDFSDGLPNVEVAELEIHGQSGKLMAATYGRGIWESYLYGTAQGISEGQGSLKVYPNPGSDRMHIEIEEGMREGLRLDLFNAAGMHLRAVNLGMEESGAYELDRGNLPAGLYFLRLKNAKGVWLERVVWQ
jgi:hypothetical protein